MITLTDKGAEKVREFLAAQNAVAETAGLRVGVRGGGCSGFQYALAFDEQRDNDVVFEDKGIRLLVDQPSLPYVRGSVIDFVDGLQGAGFKAAALRSGSPRKKKSRPSKPAAGRSGPRAAERPCWRVCAVAGPGVVHPGISEVAYQPAPLNVAGIGAKLDRSDRRAAWRHQRLSAGRFARESPQPVSHGQSCR